MLREEGETAGKERKGGRGGGRTKGRKDGRTEGQKDGRTEGKENEEEHSSASEHNVIREQQPGAATAARCATATRRKRERRNHEKTDARAGFGETRDHCALEGHFKPHLHSGACGAAASSRRVFCTVDLAPNGAAPQAEPSPPRGDVIAIAELHSTKPKANHV